AMSSTTGLALTPRETPQSVSVITKNQINDQGITTLADALKTTTGVNVVRQGNRTHFQSRGFYIEKLEEDGMATTIGAPGIFGSPARDGHNITDLAMYDHIEVVRGAVGLTQSNSTPGGTINAVRKKPTVKKQISMNGLADRFGKRHIELDASGTLSSENQFRGRIVGSFDHDKTFQD
ncbi:TonB-dependent receptor plug domain-containing protein, partial [Neisseria sp. P0021.S006]|uniref:TonB-dependent receptor plug domain-containing protein n=1 Tax=Neisseria sp. P0021.S006 TaxID=3436821 RepID=UPI003F807B69